MDYPLNWVSLPAIGTQVLKVWPVSVRLIDVDRKVLLIESQIYIYIKSYRTISLLGSPAGPKS